METRSLHPLAFITSRVNSFSSVIFGIVKVGVVELITMGAPPEEYVYVYVYPAPTGPAVKRMLSPEQMMVLSEFSEINPKETKLSTWIVSDSV